MDCDLTLVPLGPRHYHSSRASPDIQNSEPESRWENFSFYGNWLHVPNKRVGSHCPSRWVKGWQEVLLYNTGRGGGLLDHIPGAQPPTHHSIMPGKFEDWKLNCQLSAVFKNQTPKLLEVISYIFLITSNIKQITRNSSTDWAGGYRSLSALFCRKLALIY